MRFVWLVFAGLLAAMVFLLPRLNRPATTPVAAVVTTPAQAVGLLRGTDPRAASVVAFGLAQRGTPYVYAGTSPLTGFDCSGFILYTFAQFGVAVPHSTALLIGVGRPVDRAEAQAGDIVVFTGTDSASTTPGHAGIVVSGRGERPLRFVHSSSARRESGVKVSQIEGTGYERRFLQVRRVLEPGAATSARTSAPAPVKLLPAAGPVAALPSRPVPVVPVGPAKTLALPPPAVLAVRTRPTTTRPARPPVRATPKAAAGPQKIAARKAPVKKARFERATTNRAAAKNSVAKKPLIKKAGKKRVVRKKTARSR